MDRGFLVLSVKNDLNLAATFGSASRQKKIKIGDFLIFNQQFNTLIKAGLPILKSLDLLAERAAAPHCGPFSLMCGSGFARARCSPRPWRRKVRFLPSMSPRYGRRASGSLTGVIDQYIAYLRVSTGFRNRLMTALIYPSVLVVAAVVMLTYWSPMRCRNSRSCTMTWHSSCRRLPQFMLAIALPLRHYFFVFIVAVRLWQPHIYLWTRSDRGALAIDRSSQACRCSAIFWLKAQIAQFVRTLSTLLAAARLWSRRWNVRRRRSAAV